MDDDCENARLIRLPDVLKIIPVSKSIWWDGIKTGLYPKPVRIGRRTVAWSRKSILALAQNGLIDK